RRATGHIHAAFMSPVEMVDVGRIGDRLAVVRNCDVLDFAFAGREFRCDFTFRRDAVQMTPAGLLPGEDQLPSGSPKHLLLCFDVMKHATGSLGCMKHVMCKTGPCVSNTNGPRLSFPLRAKGNATRSRRYSHISD